MRLLALALPLSLALTACSPAANDAVFASTSATDIPLYEAEPERRVVEVDVGGDEVVQPRDREVDHLRPARVADLDDVVPQHVG